MFPYVVIPDVNIYLTVCRQLCPGFSMKTLCEQIEKSKGLVTSGNNNIFYLLSTLVGKFPSGEDIEIWSGEHILNTAMHVAGDSLENNGLGWDRQALQSIPEMIYGLTIERNGGFTKQNGTYHHPPLDYEDASVMQCARDAHPTSSLCKKYCITYDKDMCKKMEKYNDIIVLSPQKWCELIRRERSKDFFNSFLFNS